MDGNEIKLVTFANDMTSFVRDIQSHITLLDVIKTFGKYSGLKMNQDKTEALLLGNYAPNNLNLGTIEFKKSIKILGVHFTYNSSLFYKLNFEATEKSLRNMLKSWDWRGLTVIGKIQVLKSFALPKILYRLTMIANKKEFIKKANTLLYHFVWKGKDKVKRAVLLISPTEKGGLKMPDLDSMIAAQKIISIAPRVAGWKFILESYLKKVRGKFLFQCNFDF